MSSGTSGSIRWFRALLTTRRPLAANAVSASPATGAASAEERSEGGVARGERGRRRGGGQLGRQPPGELAVALARRSLAGGEPRDAEPRVIGKQRHEMLPDDARGAEYADVDFLHQTAAGTAAFSA